MSTVRNSLLMLASQVCLLFSGFAVNFGLGRFLGPELYGQFGIILAVSVILNLLFVPGVSQAVSKFCAEDRKNAGSVVSSMLRYQLVLALGFSVLFFFLSVPIAMLLKDISLSGFLRILTPLVFVYSISAVYAGFFSGTGRFFVNSAQVVSYAVSRFVLTIVFAYFFGLVGAVTAVSIAAISALIFFVAVFRDYGSADSKVIAIYRLSIPITLFSVFLALFQSIDLFIVKAVLQDNVLAGFYTAAGMIARIPYFVLSALGVLLLPIVAGRLADRRDVVKFIQESFRYVIMLLFPSAAVFSATGGALASFLYRHEYIAAGAPLEVLAFGMAGLTLLHLFSSVLFAKGSSMSPVAISFSSVVLSVILCIILTPVYGITGAAVGVSVSAVLFAGVSYVFVFLSVGNPVSPSSFFRIITASAMLYAICSFVELPSKFILPLFYAGLVLVYFLILAILGELKKKDFERFIGIIH